MKILVIEDKLMHQESAKETLAGHDVTIVDSFDKAMWLLQPSRGGEAPFPFEVVLTDMMMPMSEETLVREAYKPDEQVPYGFIIALMAARCGAKFVGMLTDTNHHQGAMSAGIDYLSSPYYDRWESFSSGVFNINGAKVVFVHTPFVQKITKDVPCDLCVENPGVCSNCNGTGLNKNPNWQPKECHRCHRTDTEGKCTRCKGTERYDRTDTLDTKDWGRVLTDLTTKGGE